MESTDITWRGTCIDEVLCILWKAHANILSHQGSCCDVLWSKLACLWDQTPKSHLLCTTHSKLVVLGWSKLDIFGIATPNETPWPFIEYWRESKWWYNMAVSCIPNKHFTIKCVPCWQQQSIIMRKGKVYNFVIMLWKYVNGPLAIEVSNYYVRVLSPLAKSDQSSIVWNWHAGDLIIMCSHEVLVVWVWQIMHHNISVRNKKYIPSAQDISAQNLRCNHWIQQDLGICSSCCFQRLICHDLLLGVY